MLSDPDITSYLVNSYGFNRSTRNPRVKGMNPVVDCDCYLRVGDIHTLTWNDDLKHFSLVVTIEQKGNFSKIEYRETMIPKAFYNLKKIDMLLSVLL
jgi:hypothetical protein